MLRFLGGRQVQSIMIMMMMMLTLMSCCSNSCDCTHKRPVETMRSLPSEAMCLVAMIDCEGWLVSAEDAMNMAEEALDLCLEVQDHR